MTVPAFVDTNIWFYALSASDEAKRVAANTLIDSLEMPMINGQVVRELCTNLLKKSSFDEAGIVELIRLLHCDCRFAPENAHIHLRASGFRQQKAFSYWDSLIVGAALEAGCETLYREDMQHQRLVDGSLRIINPFLM